MSIVFDIMTTVGRCILAAIAIVVIIALFSSVLAGCNAEQVADQIQKIIAVDDEIEILEKNIVKAQTKLDLLPLTDLARGDLEAEVQTDKELLKLEQAKRGKLVKDKNDLDLEDDALLGEVGKAIESVTPLGFGGLISTGLLLIKGFRRHRAYKSGTSSIQSYIDDLPEKDKQTIRDKQTPGAKKLIDGLQGKTKIPILPF